MSAVLSTSAPVNHSLALLVANAASQIAPVWPLDQAIAVNPWWPKRANAFASVCAEQQLLAGTDCLMSANWYLSQWQQQISAIHLQQALDESHSSLSQDEAVAALRHQHTLPRWKRLCELLTEHSQDNDTLPWQQLILQQLSQFLALYHQYPERFAVATDSPDHLYQSWLSVVRQDKGLRVLTGTNLLPLFDTLPDCKNTLLAELENWLTQWCPSEQSRLAYLEALLQSISGWAGWQSWLDWQKQLQGEHGHKAVCQLLYMLLGWDWVLWQFSCRQPNVVKPILAELQQQAEQYHAMQQHTKQLLSARQLWQRALEISVQTPLLRQLQQAQQQLQPELSKSSGTASTPVLQAAFCIDVRSEPMRRALEKQHPAIQTLGFAGFFGLPLAYQAPDSTLTRPQLPGLFAPAITVTQIRPEPATLTRQPLLGWKQSFDTASSSLGMVEAAGPVKLISLIKKAFFRPAPHHALNKHLDDSPWQLIKQNQALSIEEQAELCAAILSAMGLKLNLAPTVLLFGHGSQSCNNPHAAALDCGACGGQTGEVNVKVLAQLLNDSQVRTALAQHHNIVIPAETRFYGAMHHTTTDALQVFQAPEQTEWLSWLDAASKQARTQRATQFSDAPQQASGLAAFFANRSRDWAQLRPEWGLANNAAFVVAPRELTQTLDLQGRCFLHDYNADNDTDFALLNTIMTAPMVVTNWINLQYYASVVAPEKYGSGNKLLHNVVGGHIGVFEGNGGDLRNGLSWQSVHDGQKLRHQPVRLSVIIAAPARAISDIIAKAPDVAALVNNQWLWLFQLDANGQLQQWQPQGWQQVKL